MYNSVNVAQIDIHKKSASWCEVTNSESAVERKHERKHGPKTAETIKMISLDSWGNTPKTGLAYDVSNPIINN